MANPTLTVHAYGNVDALHGIFNAVAMVMGSGDFEAMVRVGVVIGFIVVATLAVIPGNLQKGWNWFIAVAVISGVLLIPKADVSIQDRLGLQPTVVVANVPWTLALVAHVKSALGSSLTQLVETAFQTIPDANRALPAELAYLRTGMMFGSRMVQASRAAEPVSQYDHMDLVQYVRNCVLPDQGRTRTPDQMARSTDLLGDMGDANPALASGYHNPAANWRLVIDTCPNVWAALQQRLNAAGAAAVVKAASTTMAPLYRADPAAAQARVAAAIPAIYAKARLASAASTASSIMLQNILINATADAAAMQSVSANAPATLTLALMRTQATAAMNAGNLVQGRIAEESLPMIRNVTEAILYAVFPVLCVILVASEAKGMGTLFKSYLYVLVWVELWPPMFAIVNYLQTLETAKHLAGAGYMPGATGLSISTASSVYASAVSGLGTTAWFVTFVPVIAAAVLFGFDKMMSVTGAMGGGVTGGVRSAQGEASAAVKGNVSMGNVGFDRQQLDAYRSDPASLTTVGVGGQRVENLLSGERVETYASSRHLSSAAALASIGQGLTAAAKDAEASTLRNQKAYETSLDAAFTAARGAMLQHSKTTQKALGYDLAKVGSDGLTATEVNESAKSIAQRFGISDISQVAKALSLSAGGLLTKAGVTLLAPNASTAEQEQLQKAITQDAAALHRLGTARKQDLTDSYRSSESFSEARAANRAATDRVESAMRDAASHKQALAADQSRSSEVSANWQAFQDYAQSNRTEFGNLVEQEFQRRGMTALDGVADPRAHEAVIRDMFEKGSFRSDGPNGARLYIPSSAGLGPTPEMVAPAQQMAVLGRQGVREAHEKHAAGMGEHDVRRAHRQFLTQEGLHEAQLGVRPTDGVNGTATKEAVARGQTVAGNAAQSAETRTHREQGKAQLRLDTLSDNVSDHHQPVLRHNPVTQEPIRNKALDEATGASATPIGRTFADQAQAESAKTAAARAEFLAYVGKAAIPGATPRAEIPTSAAQRADSTTASKHGQIDAAGNPRNGERGAQ